MLYSLKTLLNLLTSRCIRGIVSWNFIPTHWEGTKLKKNKLIWDRGIWIQGSKILSMITAAMIFLTHLPNPPTPPKSTCQRWMKLKEWVGRTRDQKVWSLLFFFMLTFTSLSAVKLIIREVTPKVWSAFCNRYVGMTLGDLVKRCCLDNCQIRGSVSHNCIVGEARSSEGIVPMLLGCKGEGEGRDLQYPINVAL